MTTTQEFFQNTEINGALTPDQAAELMALAESGDTSAMLDDGGVPTTTTETENAVNDSVTTNETLSNSTAQPPAAGPGTATLEIDPSKAVVLAKDGIHTIPYDKLVEARATAQQLQTQLGQVQQERDALKAAADVRADNGLGHTNADQMAAAAEAAIQAGADPSIFGSFSEEDLASGISKVVEQSVDAKVQVKLEAALAPFKQMLEQQKQEQAKSESSQHYDTIFARHPDAASIAQSVEMDAWIQSHPSYAQPALQAVLEQGSAAQVIELFDNFKKAAGASTTPAADLKQAAKAAIDKVQPTIPASLSAIPGGRVDGLSAFERLSNMDPAAMTDAMQGMTPEQIEAFLNRNL